MCFTHVWNSMATIKRDNNCHFFFCQMMIKKAGSQATNVSLYHHAYKLRCRISFCTAACSIMTWYFDGMDLLSQKIQTLHQNCYLTIHYIIRQEVVEMLLSSINWAPDFSFPILCYMRTKLCQIALLLPIPRQKRSDLQRNN